MSVDKWRLPEWVMWDPGEQPVSPARPTVTQLDDLLERVRDVAHRAVNNAIRAAGVNAAPWSETTWGWLGPLFVRVAEAIREGWRDQDAAREADLAAIQHSAALVANLEELNRRRAVLGLPKLVPEKEQA